MLRIFRGGMLTKVLKPCITKWRESRPIERAAVAALLAGTLFCCWQIGEDDTLPVPEEEIGAAADRYSPGEAHRAVPLATDKSEVKAIRGGEAAGQRLALGDPFQADHPGPEKVQTQGIDKGHPGKGYEAAAAARKAAPGEERTEGKQAAKGKAAQLELQGIIQSEDRLGALLLIRGNTYLLGQGETQGNIQVLSINSAGVEIQQDGQVKWLQLP